MLLWLADAVSSLSVVHNEHALASQAMSVKQPWCITGRQRKANRMSILELILDSLSAAFPDLRRAVPMWIKWTFVVISIPLLIWIAWSQLS
jgi:hypothetical protein